MMNEEFVQNTKDELGKISIAGVALTVISGVIVLGMSQSILSKPIEQRSAGIPITTICSGWLIVVAIYNIIGRKKSEAIITRAKYKYNNGEIKEEQYNDLVKEKNKVKNWASIELTIVLLAKIITYFMR